MSEAGVLFPEREACFGDGPHQSISHGVQKLEQLVATLQLLAALRRAEAHVWQETPSSPNG